MKKLLPEKSEDKFFIEEKNVAMPRLTIPITARSEATRRSEIPEICVNKNVSHPMEERTEIPGWSVS